jgi:hypothetical protein
LSQIIACPTIVLLKVHHVISELNNLSFLDEFFGEPGVPDIVTDQLCKLTKNVIDLKTMVSKIGVNTSYGGVSFNSTSSHSGILLFHTYQTENSIIIVYASLEVSSLSKTNQLMHSASEDIFNNPEKVEHVIVKNNSSRGLRIYSKELEKNGTQKNAVIDMCIRWLKNQKITYDLVDNYETDIKRIEDAKKRYNNAYSLLVLFCKTRYSKNDAEFRRHNLSKFDRNQVSTVVEHLVLQTLSADNCLPLAFATDSWVIKYLMGVIVRNDEERKAKILSKKV